MSEMVDKKIETEKKTEKKTGKKTEIDLKIKNAVSRIESYFAEYIDSKGKLIELEQELAELENRIEEIKEEIERTVKDLVVKGKMLSMLGILDIEEIEEIERKYVRNSMRTTVNGGTVKTGRKGKKVIFDGKEFDNAREFLEYLGIETKDTPLRAVKKWAIKNGYLVTEYSDKVIIE